ncbi:MAG: hypothetical protein AB1374_05965 [Bacillota bacterium]
MEGEYFWRCKCGDRAVNTPDGEGLRAIRRHRMNSMKTGDRGHYIEGLFDAAGNCLVKGDDPETAVELGFLDAVPVPVREQRKAARKSKAGAQLPEKGVVKNVSNLQGVLTAMRIALPPSVWGWLALGFRYLRKEDGSPFTWTPEDVGLYISEVITHFHQEHLPEFFGLNQRQAAAPDIARQLAAIAEGIRQMDRGAMLPVEIAREGSANVV